MLVPAQAKGFETLINETARIKKETDRILDADYTTVHPSYGTLDDFKTFLDVAHARGLRVVTELVINALKYAFGDDRTS